MKLLLKISTWIIGYFYIFFEINLIKELGFDVNLNNIFNNLRKKINFINIKLDNFKYEVPNFLINEFIPNEIKEYI